MSLIYAVVVLPALFQIYIVGADGIVVVAQLYAFLKVAAVTTSALYALCCTGAHLPPCNKLSRDALCASHASQP